MRVHLYSIVWNEEEMLPFFFRHYDSLVDRYVIYDDGSTDRTLEMLGAHDRVEVRPFVRSDPDSYVLAARILHDNVWKESRGHADWVIISDRRTSLSSRWTQVVITGGGVARHYGSPGTGVPDGRR